MTARREVVIGLDVGTTAVKAVAFALADDHDPEPGRRDRAGDQRPWRHVASREYALLHPAADQEVQEPATILRAVSEALADCVHACSTANVVAIGVASAMHGLLGLDADAQPLTPLITWADGRAHPQARALRLSGQAPMLHELCGVPVHPMTPFTKLLWLAEHEPRLLRTARWWAGLKDYVLWWLSGTLVTELSSASGTGLLDLAARRWSTYAAYVCSVSVEQLPRIVATTAQLTLGDAAARATGLPPGIPVVAGAGDGPLGNLGTGALQAGVAGLSLGTSGAVRVAVDEPRRYAGRVPFCYALTDATWVVGDAISNGASVIRWAAGALAPDLVEQGGHADAAVLELAQGVPPGAEGLVMVPYLMAERGPLWDPSLPGAYLGLRGRHRRGHLVRAAVEGVAMQVRLMLDRLHAAVPIESVRATGGAFASPLWREVVAAIAGRPVQVVAGAEGTALGAAALGLFALGRAPTPLAARAQLGAGTQALELVAADPRLTATYDELRASVPRLVAMLGEVAQLFDAAP